MNIDWTNAAVIAAVVAGVFALTKEFIAFALNATKEELGKVGRVRAIRYRLAQFYMHAAVATMKSLAAWDVVKAAQEQAGTLIEPLPPELNFLAVHSDTELERDVLELAGEKPSEVMQYFHLNTLLRSSEQVLENESQHFQNAPFYFSYPNTRRHLREVLVQSINAMEEIVVSLRGGEFVRSADRHYATAAQNLKAQAAQFPVITQQQIQQESFAAVEELARRGMLRAEASRGDAGA